jgi:hypothetical protein
MQTNVHSSAYEQIVRRIMRSLPPERVLELVDFARFLEFQTTRREEYNTEEQDNETEEASQSGDERWEQLLAKPEAKRVMREMAREALEDYRAGRTTDINITEDGQLAPV